MAKALRDLPAPSLYESDYYSWASEQAALLRERRFAELDLVNLVEEVEDLGRRQADELASRYQTLLMHLLKWEFQPNRRSASWEITIGRERRELVEHLADNPGLRPRRMELLTSVYLSARDNAAIETKLPLTRFPTENPYTLEQVTDPGFWPGGRELPARKRAR